MNKNALFPMALCAILAFPLLPAKAAEPPPDPLADGTLREWIRQMKEEPRGPFWRIRWFCADGAILEPSSACRDHGGGVQHGQWSERTRRIRAAGYPIANVLAALKPQDLTGPGADPDFPSELLIEKFLVAFDDGWILRKARFYRGALQNDDENNSATALLRAMLGDPAWRQQFALLREAARLLPHGADNATLTRLRGMAATLAGEDPQFGPLRNKIHNAPDAADARRVRDYAAGVQAKSVLRRDYAELAQAIDGAYGPKPLPEALESLGRRARNPELAARLRQLTADLRSHSDAQSQFDLNTEALVLIREHLFELGPPSVRLMALDASLTAELTSFTASRELLLSLPHASRAQRLAWLGTAARAVYGTGLLTRSELAEVERALRNLPAESVPLGLYRQELDALSRAPAWSERRLAYHFGNAVERFARIEPLAQNYISDRLRSSAMLFYSGVLESVSDDAGRLSGARSDLFGQPVGAGLRRLNPGIARGVLRLPEDAAATSPAIYLVPETAADLPPASGILTAEEGNALSHVQLLARNLGVPNAVVGPTLLSELETRRGKPIVVAASPGGVVRIEDDGPDWDAVLDGVAQQPLTEIHAGIAQPDLTRTDLIPTTALRADDAGRIVGPKAAQVGELTHRFPTHVSPGLAIPFGVFREVLGRPVAPGGPAMFEWMKAQYAELAALKNSDPETYGRRVSEFLSFVRRWIQDIDLGTEFRDRLRRAMRDCFGPEGSYGVFVRSDTNIEDQPGFTGAGLNRTIANVVKDDDVIEAIKTVWASPFTDRAYGWRQGLMEHPEQIYVSVLLHRSVPNDASGVMITADPDTGDRDFITVVANAGVGGAVEGQAAETLRVSATTGEARLLASATARTKRILSPAGGIQEEPSDAPDYLLTPDEIAQLVSFARALPADYPGLRDAEGRPAPADIEFGFADGKLMLLQIRPFLQNRAALRNRYLNRLDAGLRDNGGRTVDLREVPPAGPS